MRRMYGCTPSDHAAANPHTTTSLTPTDDSTGYRHTSFFNEQGGAGGRARGPVDTLAEEYGSTDPQPTPGDRMNDEAPGARGGPPGEPCRRNLGVEPSPEPAAKAERAETTTTARARTRGEDNDRRTTLQVASLNINGFGSLVRDHPDNKWGRIYRLMSEHRIGILLLQETHLTEERKAGLHRMFARKVKIFHSANPDAPTQREGVAIVLNCRYLNTTEAKATEIVPGRALQVSLPGPGGDVRNVLCIYAPTSNGVNERKLFFKEVSAYYEAHPEFPKPHLMAGDFNTVEDKIDRLPINEGPDQSVVALDDLKCRLGLMLADGWRITYPNTREYTFHRGTGKDAVFSRLDRIYVSPATFEGAREWRICEASVKTDHSMVLVQLTSENSPVIGPGRPLFPLTLIRDRKLTKQIKALGIEAGRELSELEAAGGRSEEANPQVILFRLKQRMMKAARTREREVIPRLLAEIREGEVALRKLKANRTITEEEKIAEAAALTKQVRQLKQRRVRQQQQNSRATHRLYGDRPTKYWSKLHRECAPRDVINAFEKEGLRGTAGEKVYEKESAKMASMARTHHVNVQKDDPGTKTPDERERDITLALDSIDASATDAQAARLGDEVSYEECVSSLRFAKNGTAPGLDGIPFEVWKALHARYTEDSRFPDRTGFDVVGLLRAAFEDMRVHGVSTKTGLAHGWMAPIYKEKGERTRVVNYRPITLLNTDYKLLSKILAVRLAEVAPQLIHRAQAGFVPGRKIQNHTQLARLMMHWAEENEENGAIVALDQEKAYDKIAHDYLWRVLQKFGIPATFIHMVQSLYKGAVTSVMINGILSEPYRIYRGVRQGDPLSCLLFDLAIEPLSAMIRKSDIKGFNIPRCNEVLKAVLFADDTTVYLSCDDDFGVLQHVLDTWCSAAKARFNLGKTEIIPLGTPAFREEMAATYQASGAWKNYPRGVHVARDGEAVRILGAFFGNGVDQIEIWTLVLTKIVAMRKPLMHAIDRWKAGHATLQGKKHVVQMIVGGMTQFFTTVQRMPDQIVTRLNKIIREYLWDDRHSPPVSMEHVYLPVEKGGLAMLDLKARSDAIDIMWLKAYLDFGPERPIWAFLADDLIANHVTKGCRPRLSTLRVNTFLQRWKPRAYGLPEELQSMMRVAKKFGARLEGLAFSKQMQKDMPMWDHAHADKTRLGRLSVPSKLLNCLLLQHKLATVGEFVRLTLILADVAHCPRATCRCLNCASVRRQTGCTNPHSCASRARDMLDTLPPKWDPRTRQPEDYEEGVMRELADEELGEDTIPFDRRLTTYGGLGQAIRIFTDANPVSVETASMEIDEDGSALEVATDGSCLNNGERDAQAGAGVYVEHRPDLCRSFRLPSWLEQSNQTGEAVATLLGTTAASMRTRTTQITDSKTTMGSLLQWRGRHEDTGYILQRNADLTRAIVANIRMRGAHTLFKWTKGHAGHAGNEEADGLAADGAAKPSGDHLNIAIPPLFRVSGAKLQAMTQKLAYRAIRHRADRQTSPRPRTEANMDRITSGLQAACKVKMHDATVWKSLRTKHISRHASQFMWMAIHDGYMLGTHWLRTNMSDELRQRATCTICGECETMTHVAFDCTAVGQETIWKLLETTWRLTGIEWPGLSWGTVFGAACVIFRASNGNRKTAAERLWCIICTEAVHLIWKLRCERVIQNEGVEFTEAEVTNRFFAALESRLSLDRRTSVLAKGKRSLRPQEVARIWSPILDRDCGQLPPRWVGNCGVLVGIKRGR